MMNRIKRLIKPNSVSNRQIKKIQNDVQYQAVRETRTIRDARIFLLFFAFLVALILSVDYTMGLTLFSYLDPSLGNISLGPPLLALSIPIAVIVIHLIISSDDSNKIEDRLRRFASVGGFLLLFAMSAMVALVLYDSSDGLGRQGKETSINGVIGNETLGSKNTASESGIFAVFDHIFAGIPRILFFCAMSLVLFVSVYGVHVLLLKIEENYKHFHNSSRRSQEIKQLGVQADELLIEIDGLDAELEAYAGQCPRDLEKRFSQITSSAISDALHEMKKALRDLGKNEVVLEDVILSGVVRPDIAVPPHIRTRTHGQQVIAEIRQDTTPYAILKNLGAMPPKEEF